MSLAPAQRSAAAARDSLRDQLHDFRRRVWTIKMIEAVAAAALRPGASRSSSLFALDRVWDTPAWVACRALRRGLGRPAPCSRWPSTAGSGGIAGSTAGPAARPQAPADRRPASWASSSWCASDSEQARSRDALRGRHRAGRRGRPAARLPRRRAQPAASALGRPGRRARAGRASACSRSVPTAATNAWQRLLAPWRSTPRYTFAAVEPLPDHAGRRPRRAVHDRRRASRDKTAWQPATRARSSSASSTPITAPLRDGALRVRAARADRRRPARRPASATAVQRVRVEPTLRPELTSVVADVTLPDYLGPPGAAAERRPRRRRSRWSRGAKATLHRHAPAASSRPRQVDGKPTDAPGPTVVQPGDPVDGAANAWSSAGKTASAWPARSRSCSRSTAATTRPPRSPARTCPARRSCSTPSRSTSRCRPRTISASSASACEWQGVDDPIVKSPAKGEQHPGRRRPRQGDARGRAAPSRPRRWASSRSRSSVRDLRRGLLPGPRRGSIRPPTRSTSSTPSSTPSG